MTNLSSLGRKFFALAAIVALSVVLLSLTAACSAAGASHALPAGEPFAAASATPGLIAAGTQAAEALARAQTQQASVLLAQAEQTEQARQTLSALNMMLTQGAATATQSSLMIAAMATQARVNLDIGQDRQFVALTQSSAEVQATQTYLQAKSETEAAIFRSWAWPVAQVLASLLTAVAMVAWLNQVVQAHVHTKDAEARKAALVETTRGPVLVLVINGQPHVQFLDPNVPMIEGLLRPTGPPTIAEPDKLPAPASRAGPVLAAVREAERPPILYNVRGQTRLLDRKAEENPPEAAARRLVMALLRDAMRTPRYSPQSTRFPTAREMAESAKTHGWPMQWAPETWTRAIRHLKGDPARAIPALVATQTGPKGGTFLTENRTLIDLYRAVGERRVKLWVPGAGGEGDPERRVSDERGKSRAPDLSPAPPQMATAGD